MPISVVLWTQYLWFSIFLAGLAKSIVLKYGGARYYLKLRPLFLGLVLGQYVGAAVWGLVHGLTGVTGCWVFLL